MIAKSIVAVFVASTLSVGCHRGDSAEKTGTTEGVPAGVHVVSLDDVTHFVEQKSAVIFDANGADTRKEFGVIPGAVLLTSHDSYALSELPSNKAEKLVFYCGGLKCRASDAAAERAEKAGYTDVNILREGIKGWKAAGRPTAPQS